jgi:hypothetical protein
MARFKISYLDPKTGEPKVVFEDIEPTENITAREWAEDHAYSLADKGKFEIEEIKQPKRNMPDISQLPKGYSLLPEGAVVEEGDLVNFPQSSSRWVGARTTIGSITNNKCFAARQSEESRLETKAEIKEKQLRFDPKFKNQNYGSW